MPGDGYKAQITAVKLARLHAGDGRLGDPRADRAGSRRRHRRLHGDVQRHGRVRARITRISRRVEALTDAEIEYELEFVHDETGRIAVENEDYKILERPAGMAHKISGRAGTNA